MSEPMEIILGQGDRVDARYRGRTISTDQRGETPRPFDLFLASIGTCSGIYIAKFCEQRGIDSSEIRLRQHLTVNPETHRVERIELELELPEGFPEKYRKAVVHAAEHCAVKRHLVDPPVVEVKLAAVAAA